MHGRGAHTACTLRNHDRDFRWRAVVLGMPCAALCSCPTQCPQAVCGTYEASGLVGPLRTIGSRPGRAARRAAEDAGAPQGLHEGVGRATEGGGGGDEVFVAQFDRLGRMPVSALLDDSNQAT